MLRIAALALFVDGVLQVAGLASVWATLWDRTAHDQTLAAGHVLSGLLLVAAAAMIHGAAPAPPVATARRLTWVAVSLALTIAAVETTWFNYPGTVARVVIGAVILFIVQRSGRPSR